MERPEFLTDLGLRSGGCRGRMRLEMGRLTAEIGHHRFAVDSGSSRSFKNCCGECNETARQGADRRRGSAEGASDRFGALSIGTDWRERKVFGWAVEKATYSALGSSGVR